MELVAVWVNFVSLLIFPLLRRVVALANRDKLIRLPCRIYFGSYNRRLRQNTAPYRFLFAVNRHRSLFFFWLGNINTDRSALRGTTASSVAISITALKL